MIAIQLVCGIVALVSFLVLLMIDRRRRPIRLLIIVSQVIALALLIAARH